MVTLSDDVIQRYRDGDDSLRDEIILSYMPLAYKLARKYGPDAIGNAMLGLVQGVTWARTALYDNNIGPYLNITIRRFITEHLNRDHLIPIPREAWRKMLQSLSLENLDDAEAQQVLKTFYTRWLVLLSDENPDIVIEDPNELIFKEAWEKLNLTELEAEVLTLRLQGYTLQEIGSFVNRSHPAVFQILKKIQKRYYHVYRQHPSFPKPPHGS